MPGRARQRLTYANVMSTLAVFVALGTGGAYAANTVGSPDIIDESILSVDVKDGEVRALDIGVNQVLGSRIADGTIKSDDIADDRVGAADLAADSVGTDEVVTNSLTASDLATNSVEASEVAANAIDGDEVANGLLNAVDVGKASGTATLDFPSVSNSICRVMNIDIGVNVFGDALVLSPTTFGGLSASWSVQSSSPTVIRVRACNPNEASTNPPATEFAWVAFDN